MVTAKKKRSSFGTIQEIVPYEHYKVYWQENGKKRSHNVHGSRREASEYLSSIEISTKGAKSSTTYDKYFEAVVLPSCANLSPHTIAEYERLWKKELSPRIGGKRVSDTNFRMAQRVISDIEAPSVQLKCKRLWHKICRMAMEQDEILDRNPITRGIITKPIETREKRTVEANEVLNLMDKIKGLKYEPVILIALGCGLSPEEVLALTWEDIEFDGDYALVDINKTLLSVKGKRVLQQQKAKNKFRIRTAVLGKPFVGRLIELADEGPICKGSGYVPGNEITKESFASPTTVAHNWKRWCSVEANGTEYTSLENMRTSFSTLCGEACIPDSLVSMAMGHSDGTTRGKNYQKNTIKGMKLVASMLCDYIMETERAEDGRIGLITTSQAASVLGIKTEQVMLLCRKGKLPAQKIGHSWYIDSSKL